MSHDDRYEAVLASIGKAMAEAGSLGWQGYEREAHVFLAMHDAAAGRIAPAAPEPPADGTTDAPVSDSTTERSESEKGGA